MGPDGPVEFQPAKEGGREGRHRRGNCPTWRARGNGNADRRTEGHETDLRGASAFNQALGL